MQLIFPYVGAVQIANQDGVLIFSVAMFPYVAAILAGLILFAATVKVLR